MTTKKLPHAAALRAQLACRADYIKALGMAPEASQKYEDRYAATSGEMRGWLLKDGHTDVKEWTDYLTAEQREQYMTAGVA